MKSPKGREFKGAERRETAWRVISAGTSKPVVEEDVSNFYASYVDYNKALRSWLVAFGVGGPALFLVNEKLTAKLAASGQTRLVVTLFLVGVAAQIFGSWLNKMASWVVYHGHTAYGRRDGGWYKSWSAVSEKYWIDTLLDLLAIGAFGWSTFLLFRVFGGP